MDEKEVKKEGRMLMETSKAVYLTTIDSGGFPITRAMFNLRNREQFPEFIEFFSKEENEFAIYIGTNTSSSKYRHIKENPKIAVYFCDPDEFKGIMFGGEVDIVENLEIKRKIWLEWWTKYYSKGVEDPDYNLLRLAPKNARFYHKLHKINFELGKK
ncbi:hypothetical protein LCGC14_1110510 [marine sediment metagenome]|uniref:General stress protein FMN-binding split barrel domain-containing protein n=1 Tax=marine sediment metagenome TaxID=412755 RepID=A0A0F9QD02_9ZZZZ|nr:hypothetical protein [archaeon]